MKKKYIKSEYGKVYYWTNESTKSNTLVMLPGLTTDHSLFDKQVEKFKDDYNIIVWDCPCHGESRPYDKFSYKVVTEALDKILITEKIEKAFFIGQSLGGMIAQYYIERYSMKGLGLIAIDSAPFGDYYSKLDMFWLNQLEWMCRLIPSKIFRNSMAKMCGMTKYTRKSVLNMLSVYSKKELCHLMWIGEAAFVPENKKIDLQCPILLLLGEKDKVGKVKQYTNEWHKRTGAPLHIIKNAAHNSNQDKPDEVNALIDEYIEKWIKQNK